MSEKNEKLITVGRVGSAHGIKGWVKIHSFTEPFDNILNYQPWQLAKNGRINFIKIINKRLQNQTLIVQFEHCNDRDLAATYTGSEILIERNQLADLTADEYYWTDLEGLTITNTENHLLGTVDSVFSTGANDVLVVIHNKKRLLIPFVLKEIILNIDLTAKTILVNWDPNF